MSDTATSTVTVRLPTVLRPQANGQSTVELSGSTVGEVIAALVAQYPGLKSNIQDDDGNMRKFVNVYVNDEDIRFLDKLDTAVEAGAEVAILPAVAGG
ncbi:MAG: ubiquitin-like small modifier protein 1 [Acidimicrobiales bacterium]